MITQSESGLTPEQYNAIKNGEGYPVWSVIAHRFNLDFLAQATSPALPVEETDDWDVGIMPNSGRLWLIRSGVVHEYLDVATPANTYSIAGYTQTSKQASLCGSGSEMFAFWYNGTSIQRLPLTSDGTTISAGSVTAIPTSLGSSEIITHIAAVTANRLHIVVKDTTKRVYNLRCVEWNGATWETHNSDIWYMYPIQSIGAVEADGFDAILLATQTPGIVSTRASLDQVERYVEPSGGLIGFRYEYDTYSDHVEIDIVDNASDWRMRRSVRLSYFNGLLVATSYSVNGTKEHPFSMYRLYTSKDAVYWSMGNSLPMDSEPNRRGFKIVGSGDWLYAYDGTKIFRSLSTLRLGHSAQAAQFDLTDYIADYNITRDQALQANIKLDNSEGFFDNHPVISSQNVIALEHRAGFYDAQSIQVVVAWTEVDALEYNYAPTDRTISLVARDRIAWMSDKSQSEEARYWSGQLLGADQYTDYTKTRYGGMRHTSVQTGSWQSKDSMLQLRSNNEEGVSFSTYSSYIWNGMYECKFKLAQASGTEYAGIVFRALDKDNCMIARYNQATDRIDLVSRIGKADTTLASTTPLSWGSGLSWKWMRVEFYYAAIRILTSSDGIVWSVSLDYNMIGQHEPNTYGPVLLDNGFVGQIARGFSEEDQWTFPEFEIPNIYWRPPNFDLDEFEIDFLFDVSDVPDENPIAMVWTASGKAAFTSTFNARNPIWKNIPLPDTNSQITTTLWAAFDYASPYIAGTGAEIGAYFLGKTSDNYGAVYYCANLLADTLVWNLLYTINTGGQVITRGAIKQDIYNHEFIGIGLKAANGVYFGYTNNSGSTWQTQSPSLPIEATSGTSMKLVIDVLNSVVYAPQSTSSTSGAIRYFGPSVTLSAISDRFYDPNYPLFALSSAINADYFFIAENRNFVVSENPELEVPDHVGIAIPSSTANYPDLILNELTQATGFSNISRFFGTTTAFTLSSESQTIAVKVTKNDNRFSMNVHLSTFELVNSNITSILNPFWMKDNLGSKIPIRVDFTIAVKKANLEIVTRSVSYQFATSTWAVSIIEESGLPGNEIIEDAIEFTRTYTITNQAFGQYAYSVIFHLTDKTVVMEQSTNIGISEWSGNPIEQEIINPTSGFIPPIWNYSYVDSLARNRANFRAFAAVVRDSTNTYKRIVKTGDGGNSYNFYFPPNDYRDVYLSPSNNAYALGIDTIHCAFPTLDKRGNISDIWGVTNWQAIGMETL